MIDVASNGADLRQLMGHSLPRLSILLQIASGKQFFDRLLQRLREGMLRKTTEWEKGSIGVRDAGRFSSRILDQYDSGELLPGKEEENNNLHDSLRSYRNIQRWPGDRLAGRVR